MRVLIVEDTVALADTLCEALAEQGVDAETVPTAAAARTRIALRDLDAVVLDLGLPDLDGLDLLAEIRAEGNLVPVLVLTARHSLDVRVDALGVGADDFLVKPFAFQELLARLRALVRRAGAPRWSPLSLAGVTLTPNDTAVVVGGRRVPLSPREQALLAFLLRGGGQPRARKDILREVFGYEFDPRTNVVDVHIAHLRRKLQGGGVRIVAVRGVGYLLRAAADDDDDT
jgi:DNA-binding response OmpR family regulator